MMRLTAALSVAGLFAAPAVAAPLKVNPAIVRAHEAFLASDALRGRGSATDDEAIAAAYVASQFESFGLKTAPGWTSYLQVGPVPPTKFTKKRGIPADATTTNAVGFMPGRDPKAGIILISAHLDHLGVVDGKLFHGANDDASGTTAVLELARLLAKSGPHRRGILFVCYGAEEIGGIGSTYFAAHPPVPLDDIVANVEFEMIGVADPKFAAGSLMMTGFERSNLGPMLKRHGALINPDPYPEQKFFQRSDNYSLALKGIVAHTISGWAVTPTYHQTSDTIANIDFDFMARAIQSLVEPMRWLADSRFRPGWVAGGRPVPQRKE
jgi:hypothetical protein